MEVGYCLHLEQQQCGPVVIPAFRASVAWICRRLALECPDLKDPAIMAIADNGQSRSGQGVEGGNTSADPVGIRSGDLSRALVGDRGQGDRFLHLHGGY